LQGPPPARSSCPPSSGKRPTNAMEMPAAELCSELVLPTLLTSKKIAREVELKEPKAEKVACEEALAEAPFGHSISVKNTFVDYGSQRSPSLEPFYRHRMASSCPSSPALKGEAVQADDIAISCSPEREPMQSEALRNLREACLSMCPQVPHGAVAEAPTRCPSMDSPVEWQFYAETSPSEARSTPMAQFPAPCIAPFAEVASPFHASMYTPMCSYPVPMGGDAFCLAGQPSLAPVMQPPATPVAQPPAAVVVQSPVTTIAQTPAAVVSIGKPQARTGHTILSLADAISEPAAPPTISVELSSVVPVSATGPLGSPTARAAPMPPAPPSESPLMSTGGSMLAAAMAAATPPSPPKGPALGSVELPSVGSAGHSTGDCKPCAFFHTAGCSNGVSCQFCHTCDANEKKRRRKEKIQRERLAGKAKQPDPVA